MARNTRTRIIETALRLFNERHFGNVTTAELAAAVGVTEGNLWYHFRNKRALLDAISVLYVEQADRRLLMAPGAGDILDGYARLLAALTTEIQTFRFIFRDRADYGEHSEVLRQHAGRIYRASWAQLGRFFVALKAAGHLDIDEAAIAPLVTNAIIVIRFSFELFREMNLDDAAAARLQAWGVLQHLNGLGPALTPAARAQLIERLNLHDTIRAADELLSLAP
ncbi:TetR/AcrR family transcriptional regulator [Zavarzinia compransoris]|uniref:HTH tetR-type domain-containing protein n=1 Tax=Zavarzinia compransoris TaxID=1264899 RepID=A0A317E9C0_9PROT|nr:TetR/AcrR family transcriptional regulator [Zavarzinia compransoris]PWR23727.1 hypothetical protein DKG75_03955 [Zavarzinia compransoris]TDP47952.1 TetR family transcriptional regulator [Zavarzinia compransoris]